MRQRRGADQFRACARHARTPLVPFLYQHLLFQRRFTGLSSAASTRMLARRLGMAALGFEGVVVLYGM